jgi:phage-related tail fiber protein
VIGVSFGTADSGHFNVPDLRGRFLRGVDNGQAVDPDAATRTAIKTGGATGDNVGSLQADAFQGHYTTIKGDQTARIDLGIRSATPLSATIDEAYWTTYTGIKGTDPITDGTNGTPRVAKESRPKNVNVNYIIKS